MDTETIGRVLVILALAFGWWLGGALRRRQ
jgi:hypothetical protein